MDSRRVVDIAHWIHDRRAVAPRQVLLGVNDLL
jgi:hypothetical protein